MEQIKTIAANLLKEGGWQLLLFVIGLPIFLSIEAWPASAYFILVCGVWYFTRSSPSILAKAARSLAGPVAIGLGATSALLLAYNLFCLFDVFEMRHIETIILQCALYAEEHELSLRSALIILCVLTLLTLYLPQARPITKFVRFQKIWSKATAVLLTISSFTFFTNQTFITPVAMDINERLFVSYRMARVEETIDIGESLAMRAEILALQRSLPADRVYLRVLSSEIQHSTQHFFSSGTYLIDQQLVQSRTAIQAETYPITRERLYNNLTQRIVSFSEVDEAWQGKAVAEKVNDEMMKALKEVVSQTLGSVNDQVNGAVQDYVFSIFREASGFFTDAAAKYLDKVTEQGLEHLTDPIVDKGAEVFKQLFIAPKQEGIADISLLAHQEIARACEAAETVQIQKALAEAAQATEATKLSRLELNPLKKFRYEEAAQTSASEAVESIVAAGRLGRVSKAQTDDLVGHLVNQGVPVHEVEAIVGIAKAADNAAKVVRIAKVAAEEPTGAELGRVTDEAVEEGAKFLKFFREEE